MALGTVARVQLAGCRNGTSHARQTKMNIISSNKVNLMTPKSTQFRSVALNVHRTNKGSQVARRAVTCSASAPRVLASATAAAFPLEGETIIKADGTEMELPFWGEDETVVFALLRHFGWPFCWEQAQSLAKMKPALQENGVKLVCVGIGDPEKAQEFAERVEFPVEDLYVNPTRSVYKKLELYGDLTGEEGWFFDPVVVEGVKRLFFNPKTGEALKARGTDGLKTATKNFKPLAPPEPRDAVQQGGLYVFKGREVLLAHKDEGTGDHAAPETVLAAASCGCA